MPNRAAWSRSTSTNTASPLSEMSLATSASSGSCLSLSTSFGVHSASCTGAGAWRMNWVLGLADCDLDGQILNRLHVEGNAGQRRGAVLDAAHDRGDVGLALVMRFEVDEDAAAVQRRVGSVHADKGRKAFDVGILQDGAGELLLALGHRGIRDGLRRFRDRLDDAGILQRKESLGDDDIEQ